VACLRLYSAMLDFNSIAELNHRLPWLFIETRARAVGFLSVMVIMALLALRLELGNSWNLYAAGTQVEKLGDDNPLLLQAIGSAFAEKGGDLVVLLGGSAIREMTADDSLLSKELTEQCGRDIQFVNLGSSNQTFSESWDIAALAPETRRRLFLIGINPYRLAFDDADVISEQALNATGIPASFSLWWSVAVHTGHVGSLERILASIARQERQGAKWRLTDLFVPRPPVARPPAEDPFQPDRSSYHTPVWTRSEKQRQVDDYIAIRAPDFHDRFRTSAIWFNRLFDHFEGPESDVIFVIGPSDETFQKVNALVSGDLENAISLLGGERRVMDLRSQERNLDSNDFFDTQHLVATGREKLQPFFVAEVSRALRCLPGASR
jgi:hypothetical protein